MVRSSTPQDCQLLDEWRVMSKGGSDNGTCGKVKNPAELRITREWRQKFLLQSSLDF